jgi:hypothetical protein
MPCWQQRDRGTSEIYQRVKWECVFHPSARQSSCHQFGRGFRQNHFPMISDVITVRVGNKGSIALILWI